MVESPDTYFEKLTSHTVKVTAVNYFLTTLWKCDGSTMMNSSRPVQNKRYCCSFHYSTSTFETVLVDNFSYISGLKHNGKKCQVLQIGSMSKSDIVYLKGRKFQWSSTEASLLGMTF